MSLTKKELFYAELLEINFSNIFFNKRVSKYKMSGDSHFLARQYFEKMKPMLL